MLDETNGGEGGGDDSGADDGYSRVVLFTDEQLDFAQNLAMKSASYLSLEDGRQNGEAIFTEQQSIWVAAFRAKLEQLQNVPYAMHFNLGVLLEAVALLPAADRLSGEVGIARLVGGTHDFPHYENYDLIVHEIVNTPLMDPIADEAEEN